MASMRKGNSATGTAAGPDKAPRSIPGAGPLAAAAGKGKKKSAAAANGGANGSQKGTDDLNNAAHAAALSSKAPKRSNVDDSLKVKPADVAEQAEQQAALAAVEVVEHREQDTNGGGADGSHDVNAKGALQAVISKRIKVLNKKLQRAIQYEALDQTKVNDDQRRIVASRPGLEASVAELAEVAKALEIAENESQRSKQAAEKQHIAAAVSKANDDAERKLNTLFQLMQLHGFISPSAQRSFVQPAMPAILESATGQDVAAIGKLYSDLAASNEVTPHHVKINVLDKLSRSSRDEVLEGVSFARVHELLEGLAVPVTTQPAPAAEKKAPPPPSGSQISFIQASEIEAERGHAPPDDAPADVKQAEPEGGAVDSVPNSAIQGGTSARGEAGANGIVPGQETPQASAQGAHDGTAQAAVSEPVQTTEVGKADAGASASKAIDWSAHDEDDFGDLAIQPNGAGVNAPRAASPAPPANLAETAAHAPAVPPASAASMPASSAQETRPKGEKGNAGHAAARQGGQQRDAGRAPRSRNNTTQQAAAPPASKAPEVDEDGFTVASSKRSKFLQEKQQQAARGGRGRGGGRGGARGSNGAPGRGGRGGGNGRGRGAPREAGLPEAAQTAPVAGV